MNTPATEATKRVIATKTSETDVDTGAQCVLDMNSFTRVSAVDTTAYKKMRSELLAYMTIQLDIMLTGGADEIRIEARNA